MRVEFPWPPAILSGHAKGYWRGKSNVTRKFRHQAWALAMQVEKPEFDLTGDIYVRVTFTPPDNRSDRTNYYNRCKPILDGLADALKVNDKRFVPIMDADSFCEPEKPGKVTVEVWQ